MIPNRCIEVHTSPEDRPSVPPWFAEVVLLAQHLTTKGVLDAFAHQVRLVRGRFSRYETIDFLVLLMGYAISGERTLADFFERLAPFGTAFMALFGRRGLPHRSSLSRFLAAVDQPCVQAFRTLFEQSSFAEGWTSETTGGIFDRLGRRFMVFDVDATREAARQRALPCDPALPPAQRRLEALCGPGYKGRKRGEVVRTRTAVLQMHTHQWIGTYAGRGNGDYRAELASALRAITTYLEHFAFPPEVALVRLDGQYGDASVIAQIIEAGVCLVTRGRGYQILEHPQLQQVLAHPPTASVTGMNTGEIYEVFDGGWLHLSESSPPVRMIVSRHPVPPPGKSVTVGKRIDEWVYELFITTLDADGFLVEDVLNLYHGRGAFEAVFADEDVEEDPDRWCSYTAYGQELWQIVCQWLWNLRLTLGQTLQGEENREIEWASPKKLPPLHKAPADAPEVYGPWQWARARAGRFGAAAFTLQDTGKLQCPMGGLLWLSEVRQENAFTQRAVYVAEDADCLGCSLREQCLGPGAKGNRARRVSASRRLLPPPSEVLPQTGVLPALQWEDVAGRSLRRAWVAHWRRQYVEVLELAAVLKSVSPPSRPPRALRSHHRWSWYDRLACNAWWGPPQLRITVAGVPAVLAVS